MKLKNAEVEIEYVCTTISLHGFLGMADFLPDGQEAIKDAAEALKKKSTFKAVE